MEELSMETLKIIAKKELEIFGGKPQVNRYWNEPETMGIDILQCRNVPHETLLSCGTIGLANTDIGLTSGGKKLRVEAIGVCDIGEEIMPNIIATLAFTIMQRKKCYPGLIIKNIVKEYIDADMKHILLNDPFMWDNARSFSVGDIKVAWLMAIPVSDAEMAYADKHGVEALEDLLEEKDVDVADLWRKSVI